MNILMNGPTVVLDRSQTLALIDAAGTVASVKSGCLWITMDHDQRDIVLAPGYTWTVDRNGRTLVKAEEASSVVLTERIPTRRNPIDYLRVVLAAIAHRLRRPEPRGYVPYY